MKAYIASDGKIVCGAVLDNADNLSFVWKGDDGWYCAIIEPIAADTGDIYGPYESEEIAAARSIQ